MQLIARLAIGVSENRRKLYGVGFGIASLSGPYVLKIDGSAVVRRFFASRSSEGIAPNSPAIELKDTPAIRRQAPRNVSVIFMIICPYRLVFQSKRGTDWNPFPSIGITTPKSSC